MRRIIALVAPLVLGAAAAAPVHAQNHALHMEIFGPGLLASANYERVVADRFSGRVGIGWFPGFGIGDRLLAPLMANVLVGGGPHRLEAGGGIVMVYALNRGIEEDLSVPGHGFRRPYAAATLAYRLEVATGEFEGGIIRLGVTPLLFDDEVVTSISASAGIFTSVLRRHR
ncbi:MAG TPA: hypothetical protein VEY93_08905 [Longimicrobium sp.]|nr:hypothetical protein [Longimicrobium sp.]